MTILTKKGTFETSLLIIDTGFQIENAKITTNYIIFFFVPADV